MATGEEAALEPGQIASVERPPAGATRVAKLAPTAGLEIEARVSLRLRATPTSPRVDRRRPLPLEATGHLRLRIGAAQLPGGPDAVRAV